jgi:hypothetical protein
MAADLIPLILSGKKTSTVRLGIRDYPLGQATIISGKFQIPIEITEIEFMTIGHLDENVAESEGYDTLDELLQALRRFYPEAESEHDVTLVHFRQL